MKISNRKAGFTLVEIMIVVAIIGLRAAIAIPNFIKARQISQKNTCIANLKQIDGAINTWALEQGKTTGATAADTDIFGATPGNVVSRLLEDGRVEGVSGASLPMLLRVLTSRNGSTGNKLSAAVQRAISGGSEGVVHMNSDRCCDA